MEGGRSGKRSVIEMLKINYTLVRKGRSTSPTLAIRFSYRQGFGSGSGVLPGSGFHIFVNSDIRMQGTTVFRKQFHIEFYHSIDDIFSLVWIRGRDNVPIRDPTLPERLDPDLNPCIHGLP